MNSFLADTHEWARDVLADRITTVASGAALATPWWWPALQSTSETAATVLPILGAAWLIIKMITTVETWWRGRKAPATEE